MGHYHSFVRNYIFEDDDTTKKLIPVILESSNNEKRAIYEGFFYSIKEGSIKIDTDKSYLYKIIRSMAEKDILKHVPGLRRSAKRFLENNC